MAEDLVDPLDGDLRLEGLAEQKLVERAFELAPAAGDGARDMDEDVFGNVQRLVLGLGAARGEA